MEMGLSIMWKNSIEPAQFIARRIRIVPIQGVQIKYLTQSHFLPFTRLGWAIAQASCKPAPGHTHPQKARPKIIAVRNWREKITADPDKTPFVAPMTISTGEK
jgi:hypothetical protein